MRNNIENLSSQLIGVQQESSSTQQNLYNAQQRLHVTQNNNQSLSNQLSQMLSEQVNLNEQLHTQNNIFDALAHLLDQFRISKGITLMFSVISPKNNVVLFSLNLQSFI